MRLRRLFAIPVLLLTLPVWAAWASTPQVRRDPSPVYAGPTTRVDWERIGRDVQLANWYSWAAAQPPKKSATIPATARLQRSSYSDSESVWDRIAACESGGNWATNTGNGYYGGLQENLTFWRSYGGDEFAERPDLASREQQIVVAERARDSGRGYRPWPECGRRA